MGGDFAPRTIVDGAVLAARRLEVGVTLVGDRAAIDAELARHLDRAALDLTVVDAPECVGMDERPAQAPLGPDDSVAVGELVPHGFAGEGSLLRLGCGDGCGSSELLELSTTFQRAPTLARARRDDAGWGFEG